MRKGKVGTDYRAHRLYAACYSRYRRYPPIAVTAMMTMVYQADFLLYVCVFIRSVADRLLVIPGATGHPGGSQQVPQGMNRPQLIDYFCFFFC